MRASEAVQPDESVGEFIWRMAKEHILTEKTTDEVAVWTGRAVAAVVPLPIPGKEAIITGLIDRKMPELGLVLVRKILHGVGLLPLEEHQRLETRYPIPGRELANPFLLD